jgi:hypothetical protein
VIKCQEANQNRMVAVVELEVIEVGVVVEPLEVLDKVETRKNKKQKRGERKW